MIRIIFSLLLILLAPLAYAEDMPKIFNESKDYWGSLSSQHNIPAEEQRSKQIIDTPYVGKDESRTIFDIQNKALIDQKVQQEDSSMGYVTSSENNGYFEVDDLAEDSADPVMRPDFFIRNNKDGETPYYETQEAQVEELGTCSESKAEIKIAAERNLIEPDISAVEKTKRIYKGRKLNTAGLSGWGIGYYNGPDWIHNYPEEKLDDPSLEFRFKHRVYDYKSFSEVEISPNEIWVSSSPGIYGLEKNGTCKKIRQYCPAGEEERELDGVKVKKCWRVVDEFSCNFSKENTCSKFRQNKQCIQVASECIKKLNGQCVLWEQKFKCYGKKPEKVLKHVKTGEIFGLDLDGEESNPLNNELAEVLANLESLNELKKGLPSDLNENSAVIFPGQAHTCRKAGLGFSNCCVEKGWGQKMNFSGCLESEKMLVKKNEEGLCGEVGEFTVSRGKVHILKTKKKSYCCFPTKLARLVQEGAKDQPKVGKNWGEPEDANCRGMTPNELSRIDFSRINFSGVFQELLSRRRDINVKALNEKFNARLTQFTKELRPKAEEVTKP